MTRKSSRESPEDAILRRLREQSRGYYVWRVQDIDSKAYSIEFKDWESHEASAYFAKEKQRFPERYKDTELKRVHVTLEADRVMKLAAKMIRKLRREIKRLSCE